MPHVVVRRGFVDSITCDMRTWCGGECERCGGNDPDGRDYVRGADCPTCHGTGRATGIGPAVLRSHPVTRVVLTGVVTRSAVSAMGRVTRESAGLLFDLAFPRGLAHIEGNADRLESIISDAAILWAKSENDRQKRRAKDKAEFERIRVAQDQLAATIT
jgi:hypothetical protein